MDSGNAARICSLLSKRFPEAGHNPQRRATPFQILILTILSAQTTDRSVDQVSGRLFSRFPDPYALAGATREEVEEIIHSTGFYHVKAAHIIAAARLLAEEYGGEVPDSMDALLKIPGVGRKTANIVLYHAVGKDEGIAVDTHVMRIAKRIGLSDGPGQERIERDLMALFPRKYWGYLTDLLIAHGRTICIAKNPRCPECPVHAYCRYYREVYVRDHK